MSARPLGALVMTAIMAAMPAAGSGAPAPTVGASTSYSNNFTASGTTSGITTQSTGSTIAVFINRGTSDAVTSVTDNKGNTYVAKVTSSYNGGFKGLFLYEAHGATGGAGHTVTVAMAGSSNGLGFAVIEIKGSPTFEQSGTPTGTTSATMATSSITTTNTDLVLSFLACGDFTTQTSITDSFGSIVVSQLAGATYGITFAVGSKVQTSAGAAQDTFTMASSANGGTLIAAWHG